MAGEQASGDENVVDETLRPYRDELCKLKHEMQASYDKAVMTLSGGALGVSFAFMKDFFDPAKVLFPGLLISAWIAWGLSVSAVLASFVTSIGSLKQAIADVDAGTIYMTKGKGAWSWVTEALNWSGGALFLIGVVLLAFFTTANINNVRVSNKGFHAKPAATATP